MILAARTRRDRVSEPWCADANRCRKHRFSRTAKQARALPIVATCHEREDAVCATIRTVSELHFAHDLTEQEVAAGFDVAEDVSGTYLVVAHLVGGLLAIKITLDDGRIAYAICDEKLHPLYPNAATLDELRSRFRLTR